MAHDGGSDCENVGKLISIQQEKTNNGNRRKVTASSFDIFCKENAGKSKMPFSGWDLSHIASHHTTDVYKSACCSYEPDSK